MRFAAAHYAMSREDVAPFRKHSAAESPTRAAEAKGLVLSRTLNVLVLLFFHFATLFVAILGQDRLNNAKEDPHF